MLRVIFLRGSFGNETLNGGGGYDLLQGDRGADTFVFEASSGNDVIIDWVDADDLLDLSSFASRMPLTRSQMQWM